jgi:hypothetical protein
MASVPYIATKQEIGETRMAMTKRLMQYIQEALDKFKDKSEKYFILVHAKPFSMHPNMIKQKIVAMAKKPPMMLSCMLFGVDNSTGTLTLEWCLAGDWPTWSVSGTNEPIPEVIASFDKLGKIADLDKVLLY